MTWSPETRALIAEYELLDKAGICNPIVHSYARMVCETCGLPTAADECPRDQIRAWSCLKCGFRISTGGRSILELIDPPAEPQ